MDQNIQIFLEDVGSTNSTWLRLSAEGQMSLKYKLQAHDIVKIGSTVFLVQQITRVSNSGNMHIINSAHRGIMNDPDDQNSPRSQSKLDETSNSEGGSLCSICYWRKANIALIPCGHSSFCKECILKVESECPVCRTPITGKINIFK